MSDPRRVVLGVDIGGTKVAVGLVDGRGTILRQAREPMTVNGTAEAGFDAVTRAIDSILSSSPEPLAGIGLCAPGPLDPNTGVVLNPPNLPCWRNFPLAQKMAKTYSIPVRVDNDGNAAALAEQRWGAAKGYRYVFYATLGTGIGSGIVFDGKIYHGKNGLAAEGGHVTIDYRGPRCPCGKLGCIEVLAAGPAIANRARAKLSEGKTPSAMLDLAGGNVAAVTTEIVAKANMDGDALANEVLSETADLLVIWLGNIIDLLDPDVLVIGGGVARVMSAFFDRMKAGIPRWCVNPKAADIPLLLAHYGADAGIAGGAALCAEP